MDRRNFFASSSIGAISAFVCPRSENLDLLGFEDHSQNAVQSTSGTTHKLTETADPSQVAEAYKTGTKALGAAEVPYVYAFYDEQAQKFLNPLAETKQLQPALKKGSYVMTPSLQVFNIRKVDQVKFQHLQNQLQLGFNATTPSAGQKDLSWIFMNAVDVLLAKDDKQRQSQLTKFTSSNGKNGTTLSSDPKITIDAGTAKIQITAFGQKKKSVWTQFFDVLTKVMNSPVVSAASKGFGIPALTTEAASFVDGVLDSIQQQSSLVPLWKTGSLEFAVTEDAKARFNMKPGLWVTIDSDYAQKSKFLDGHKVDLQYQSFRVVDAASAPVDANYLVTELKFDSK